MGRKSKAEERKPQILGHFYEVLNKEGYAGATFDKVARKMGVHSSLLVHYFKSKEEMMIALVESITTGYEDFFLKQLDEVKDPDLRLKKSLELVFSKKWTKVIDASVFYGPCMDLTFRNDKVHQSYKKMFSQLKNGIDREIERYVLEKKIKGLDTEKVSGVIICLMEGFHIYSIYMENESEFVLLSKSLIETAQNLFKPDA